VSWERNPLWAKSRLFFERAFEESPEDPLFGLWCSMGLELLARAALASVSPVLLAEPDKEHRFLLQALNLGTETMPPQSIGTVQVFNLCCTLFKEFSKEDRTAAMAMVNRRNSELHTGAAAFAEYPSKVWLPGFYRACRSLTKVLGESLERLFGKAEAQVASEILEETEKEVRQRVLSLIGACQKVFDLKLEEDKSRAAAKAKTDTDKLSHERHHRVVCPSCHCDATVQGEPFGPEHTSHDNDEIVVRQSVSPRSFHCSACGLKLQGYAELDAAQLGGQYTRRTIFSPQEYYGLIDPNTDELLPYIEGYLADQAGLDEWDNE
jgi:hypothetical protein